MTPASTSLSISRVWPFARQFRWLAIVPLLALAFYWRTLGAWFMQDDFTFLSVHTLIEKPSDFLPVMFRPIAQGTIRPLSDRLFFYTLERLFGYEVLPFRILIFATLWANLLLLGTLVWRVERSRFAALLAMLLWGAHSAVAEPMVWISAYNQLQWPMLMLAALHCRLTALHTGRRRWWAAEALFFLLGFLSLELNVGYPILALGLTLVVAPGRWRTALPHLLPAAIYLVIHRTFSRGMNKGIYEQSFQPNSILTTFWNYLPQISGSAGSELGLFWMELVAQGLTVGIVACFVWALLERHRLALWGFLLFAVTLGPLLTLPSHITRYYLCTPILGVALAVACGTRRALAHRELRWIALTLVCMYLAVSGYSGYRVIEFHRARSRTVQRLVLACQEASRRHPGKMLLLAGITSEQFWSALNDGPFRLYPNLEVRLVPGSAKTIEPHPELGEPASMEMPPLEAAEALDAGIAIVLRTDGQRFSHITPAAEGYWAPQWRKGLAISTQLPVPPTAPKP